MIHIINIARAGIITDAPSFQSIGIKILNFLLSVAGIVAIIALVIAGTTYFVSFGNNERMEKAKAYAKYSVLGIIIIMGSMVLLNAIGKFFD